MTTWKAGMLITAERLQDDTPTTTTSGLTAATDFSVIDFRGYRAGNVIEVHCYVDYTGAGITPTTGNITDTSICTLPADWRPTGGFVEAIWDSGLESGGALISTSGVIQLRTASDTIATGANIRISATFIVD